MRIKSDTTRLGVLAILSLALFAPEFDSLNIVKYVAGFLISIAFITHLTRRLLFPYIDLEEYAKAAKDNPMASALVFFGICLIIAVSIHSGAEFFK